MGLVGRERVCFLFFIFSGCLHALCISLKERAEHGCGECGWDSDCLRNSWWGVCISGAIVRFVSAFVCVCVHTLLVVLFCCCFVDILFLAVVHCQSKTASVQNFVNFAAVNFLSCFYVSLFCLLFVISLFFYLFDFFPLFLLCPSLVPPPLYLD